MADDIVTRLQHAEDNGICEWQVLIDAVAEIERLRAAGDALAAQNCNMPRTMASANGRF